MVARIDRHHLHAVDRGRVPLGHLGARAQAHGDKLIEFVTDDLLPITYGTVRLVPRAERFAAMFAEVSTVMKSGYSLKEVIAIVDSIDFHALETTTP